MAIAHNLSRFDGIIILKALLENQIKFKHLERNGSIVLIEIQNVRGVVIRFIDSCKEGEYGSLVPCRTMEH